MELTDDELSAIWGVIYDEVYYGDDEIVYGDGPTSVNLRSGLEKLNAEIKRRKL